MHPLEQFFNQVNLRLTPVFFSDYHLGHSNHGACVRPTPVPTDQRRRRKIAEFADKVSQHEITALKQTGIVADDAGTRSMYI